MWPMASSVRPPSQPPRPAATAEISREKKPTRPGPQGIYQLLRIDVHARDVQGATREQVELTDQVTDGPEDLPEPQRGEG
jgi:hypothetical protein